MNQTVVTRTQRRVERKQAIWVLILVLGVAVASFALGYSLGRRGGELASLADDGDKPRLPMATQVVPPPPPKVEKVTEPQKLTFYDNLPKGDQAPLGSGINLPANTESEPPVRKPNAAQLPSQTEPAPVKNTVKAPVAAAKPTVAAHGAYVVQVASFRTQEDAGKLAARLKVLDYTPFIEKADLGDKGVWYRVLSGPYDTRDAADQVAAHLKAEEHFSALVKRR